MGENDQDKLIRPPVIEEDSSDALEAQESSYEEGDKFHRIFDYIGTKRGDAMLGRIVSLLESLTPGAKKYIEALGDVRKESPGIEYKKWLALLIVRFLVVVLALGAAIYLKQTGNLDSTTSLIIVTVATVFFTYGRKQ